MKYIIDHDYHIHSYVSLCSDDGEQTPQRILEYAENNGFRKICLTDHFWDATVTGASDWYAKQDLSHISQALPLPQSKNVKFLFGCETELNKDLTLGLSKQMCDKFDFIIIPTTHFHMFRVFDDSPQKRAAMWLKRFRYVLEQDLPFYKIGIAHPTCHLTASQSWQAHIDVFDNITDGEYARVFKCAKEKGVGIELNMDIFKYEQFGDTDSILRPYRIAKECGCKFYFGSDAHHPEGLESAYAKFTRLAELLDLEENDKFAIGEK